MSKEHPEPEKGMEGKRRLGTVVSEKINDLLGNMNMVPECGPRMSHSRTISTVLEQWFVDQKLLREEDRLHTREDYELLVAGARAMAYGLRGKKKKT